MYNLFEKLNRLSFPNVFFIATFATLVSIIPLGVFVVQQKTAITSRAVTLPPPPALIQPKTPQSGPVPVDPPILTRIYPWVGKAGDALVLEGKNLGTYPKNRRLSVGGILVSDAEIIEWTDTRIITIIPEAPHQGMPASLRIDTHPVVESQPLVFYTVSTPVRLKKSVNTVSVSGITGSVKATLYTSTGQRDITVPAKLEDTIPLFTLSQGEQIRSIILTDETGSIIPYSITPQEFGF